MRQLVLIACIVALATAADLRVNVKYPENKVTQQMVLRGSSCGLSWESNRPLTKSGTDTWSTNVNCTDGQMLELKAMLGAVWQVGANTRVLVVKSGSVDVYPHFTSTKGDWKVTSQIYSPQLSNSRAAVVYTPPSYLENTIKPITNVLIMHDGQNLFDPKTSAFGTAWMVQDTINARVLSGEMDEVLVVGLYNTGDRMNEYTYSYDQGQRAGGKGDKYIDFIVDTVIPWTKQNYPRARIARENVAILGSSLGGLISCYAAYKRASVFGRAGCMSSSFFWNSEDFNNVVIPSVTPHPNIKLYVDSGDSGTSQDGLQQTLRVRDHLLRDGFIGNQTLFFFTDQGGQHSEIYWQRRLFRPMIALFPRNPLVPA